MSAEQIEQVRAVLQKFQDLYMARDESRLDEIMSLFSEDPQTEMIGIGAEKRGGNEWFQGPMQIRDIIAGDWQYWGDVRFDVDSAKIITHTDTAWLTTSGRIIQAESHWGSISNK